MRILASSSKPLSSVAEVAGFGSAFHFSAAFKKPTACQWISGSKILVIYKYMTLSIINNSIA